MCGLTFLFDSRLEDSELRARSSAALNRLRHRGPDGHGLFSGDGWAMGHRRLSVIDLQGSPQPMWDSNRRYCLAYNGEVYNYPELRSELEPHWQFSSNGDTEVVLAGLLLEGAGFLDRMEGMWAIALWDVEKQSLFLTRDRMGKKPLYYQVEHGSFQCASELPALRQLANASWHEDEDSTADYLRYGFALPGYTAWREVREVLPGHCLHWEADQTTVHQSSYWRLDPGGFQGIPGEAADRLREALTTSVRRRLVADVEVGAFLSGGVDSSLIVGLAAKIASHPVKTFTVGFSNPAYDERTYAQLVASHFATDHHADELCNPSPEELELLVSHVGQPFYDASLLPTALVSRVAAKHVKVALSGDGADEVFSGYQRYQAHAILRWYTRLPRSLRGDVERVVRMVPEPDQHHSRSLIKKAQLFVDIAEGQGDESSYVAPVAIRRTTRMSIAPDLLDRGHSPPGLPESVEPDDIARMMMADMLVYLPQDILTKVDRASMAASLELRSPFLDRDVVELAFSLPREWHRRGFMGKRMLRQAFGGNLPASVWRRRKQGFAVPLKEWFLGTFGQQLRKRLSQNCGPICTDAVLRILDDHQTGRRDHSLCLWQIYVYSLWRNVQH